MLQQIKVYITAKREHADKIRASIPDGFHCNSRWIYMLHTGERPVTHWLRENFDDAINADFFVHYLKAGDKLKTSLIEIGNALAYGKKIFIASNRAWLPEDDVNTENRLKLPHKDLVPWIGLTSHIKYTGTLEQTFAYIKNQVWTQAKLSHGGLTPEQQQMADRNSKSETRA